MSFCAFCRKGSPKFACKHCLLTYYCDKDCQTKHAPYHLEGIPETQRLIFPVEEDLVLPNTHYHDAGGGIIPYTAASVRLLITKTGGNVDLFDGLLDSMAKSRRQIIQDYLNQEKLFLSDSYFDPEQNKWIQTGFNIVGTLINPFMKNKSEQIALNHIQYCFDNEGIGFEEKKKSIDAFFRLIKDNVDYLSYLKYAMFESIHFSMIGKSTGKEESNAMDKVATIFKMYDVAVRQILAKYKLDDVVFFWGKRKDNVKYAIIPQNVYLYRGFGSDRSGIGLSLSRKHDYFGFDYVTTIAYQTSRQTTETAGNWVRKKSGVSVFTTKQELHVLDLTNVDTVRKVRQMMEDSGDTKALEFFSMGWKIVDNKYIKRVSGSGADDDVTVNWLCQNGFDGYIGYGFKLHDELVLCDPRTVLKLEFKKTHVDDFFIDLKFMPDSIRGQALINYY